MVRNTTRADIAMLTYIGAVAVGIFAAITNLSGCAVLNDESRAIACEENLGALRELYGACLFDFNDALKICPTKRRAEDRIENDSKASNPKHTGDQ